MGESGAYNSPCLFFCEGETGLDAHSRLTLVIGYAVLTSLVSPSSYQPRVLSVSLDRRVYCVTEVIFSLAHPLVSEGAYTVQYTVQYIELMSPSMLT